jgi:bifunctional DNA-binding transcriptional regulator/antitoxin component of YhaV-PrlF toxin-antitoxin module
MLELTVTAKGQVTLRKAVLDHLGVRPGQRVKVVLLPNGHLELARAGESHDISSVAGILHRPGQRPATIEEMQEAIEAGPKT